MQNSGVREEDHQVLRARRAPQPPCDLLAGVGFVTSEILQQERMDRKSSLGDHRYGCTGFALLTPGQHTVSAGTDDGIGAQASDGGVEQRRNFIAVVRSRKEKGRVGSSPHPRKGRLGRLDGGSLRLGQRGEGGSGAKHRRSIRVRPGPGPLSRVRPLG